MFSAAQRTFKCLWISHLALVLFFSATSTAQEVQCKKILLPESVTAGVSKRECFASTMHSTAQSETSLSTSPCCVKTAQVAKQQCQTLLRGKIIPNLTGGYTSDLQFRLERECAPVCQCTEYLMPQDQ